MRGIKAMREASQEVIHKHGYTLRQSGSMVIVTMTSGEVRRLINCRLTRDNVENIIIQAGRPKGEV